MIKPTELRIDNFLLHSPFGHVKEYVQILEIHQNQLSHCEGLNSLIYYELETYYPIPLTEEWLLKLGFVQTYKSTSQVKYEADELGHPEIGITIRHGVWLFRFFSEREHLPFQYVHQLQNLYFALTGVELQIKQLA